jgi:hypothetical protein
MNPEALALELDREPFVPLKLNLSDGTAVEIYNPAMTFINNLALYLATEQRPRTRLAGDMRLISLRHIVSVDQIRARTRRKR